MSRLVLTMLSASLEVILRLYCDKEHRILSAVKVHMRAVMGLRRWKSRGGIFDKAWKLQRDPFYEKNRGRGLDHRLYHRAHLLRKHSRRLERGLIQCSRYHVRALNQNLHQHLG
jgi:hypothetical protein